MAEPLLRRQYLVTQENVTKVHALAQQAGVPDTEIVRRAIDSYDASAEEERELSMLIDLMVEGVREASAIVDEVCTSLDKTNTDYERRFGK